MSNLNGMDMSKLMSILGKMDKNDLEKGLEKANEILKSKEKKQEDTDE